RSSPTLDDGSGAGWTAGAGSSERADLSFWSDMKLRIAENERTESASRTAETISDETNAQGNGFNAWRQASISGAADFLPMQRPPATLPACHHSRIHHAYHLS